MVARLARTAVRTAAGPLLMATALPALAPAGAAATPCVSWTGVRPPDPAGISFYIVLNGVHVLSSSYAWAVGYDFNGVAARVLIERWNGSAWSQVPGQNAGGATSYNELASVTATSGTDAWAVGYYLRRAVDQTLIERWNGLKYRVRARRPPIMSSPPWPPPRPAVRGRWAMTSAGAVTGL